MFIDQLSIVKNNESIRLIKFHKGLNLIVDETPVNDLKKTGNNVGKTTVLRLIDFCLGSDGKNIYQDPEFKIKTNTKIETFLKQNNVLISLVLKEDLDDLHSRTILIRRNFLKRTQKIQEINGIQYSNDRKFLQKLKELIFKSKAKKPSFRQIIAKNLRYEKYRLENTIKVLHPSTKAVEYEAVYLFWLGIDCDIIVKKQTLLEAKKIEEKIIQRLQKDNNKQEIEQALFVINRDIKELENIKERIISDKQYKKKIDLLNRIELKLDSISTRLAQLKLRKSLILETKEEFQKEKVLIDLCHLKKIYETAKRYIPTLHIKFEKLVEFHNNMIKDKINYVLQDLPNLNKQIAILENQHNKLSKVMDNIANSLKGKGILEKFETVIEKLNYKYEQKGKYEEQLRQWNMSLNNLMNIENELIKID